MKFKNKFKRQVVKFKDGKYAVRKFDIYLLEFVYRDLDLKNHHRAWWQRDSSFFCDCVTNNLQVAEEALEYKSNKPKVDYGEPI